MSTSLYLKCLSHDKPIDSDELGTKNSYSLADARKILIERDKWVEVYEIAKEYMTIDAWNYATRSINFVVKHPECEIGLYDGYGKRYSLYTDSYEADYVEDEVESEPEKLIHMASFLGGYAVPRCLESMILRRDDMSHEVTCPECVVEAKRLGLYTP